MRQLSNGRRQGGSGLRLPLLFLVAAVMKIFSL
jgi:hypothetical protein